MIRVNDLSHSLGGKEILKNINLTVADGTIMGLVGINGAGKSTLLRLLSGVYLADKGKIEYDGVSPTKENMRKDLFFLPDDPYYTLNTTAKSLAYMMESFYSEFDKTMYFDLLGKYKLDPKKPIRNFSKGMRRQVYIALALAIRPKYLLLDEAFDGLDPLSRKRFKDELIKLVEEKGTTVIISSHSLRELEDFCDTYTLIDGKTVAASGDIEEKVSKYCKFQLAFLTKVPDSIFDGLPVSSISRSDRFVRLVLEGDSEEMAKKLAALSPAVIEELPMNFEELFINEAGKEA
jgi:ABC-2 type transport system ATP-binding protein